MQVLSHNESELDGSGARGHDRRVGTRVNQKARTRAAIVQAVRELARSGAEITMPSVAKAALVSEATAYRYFPDLVTLLLEADAGHLAGPGRGARAGRGQRRSGRADRLRGEAAAGRRAGQRERGPRDDRRLDHPARDCRAAARAPVRPDRRRARPGGRPARSGQPSRSSGATWPWWSAPTRCSRSPTCAA